ncbi:MAG: hypothetical protein AAFW70_05230 [Cyanobacteria bacterium J06635_10]
MGALDRHSEHIACAGGKSVLSAGEVFFQKSTNQSTGFCPKGKSWIHVAKVLDLIKIPHPSSFTIEFVFRRCCACGQINIVKDNLFTYSVCDQLRWCRRQSPTSSKM